jgi:hypothetical protein
MQNVTFERSTNLQFALSAALTCGLKPVLLFHSNQPLCIKSANISLMVNSRTFLQLIRWTKTVIMLYYHGLCILTLSVTSRYMVDRRKWSGLIDLVCHVTISTKSDWFVRIKMAAHDVNKFGYHEVVRYI